MLLQHLTGSNEKVRRIPRPALRMMSWLAAGTKPELARQARAALAMDTLDMTFDRAPARQAFADLPNTDVASVLKELLA
jgi:hypothetical protein